MELAELFHLYPGVFAVVVFVFGMTIGSFLNVVIYRLPIMMERDWRRQCAEIFTEAQTPAAEEAEPFNLVHPRSACPQCKTPIAAWQNIPVVSYLMLRGRCAACGTAISPRYPTVELLTGVLSAVIALKFGFNWECLAALFLTWTLIALSGIDVDHQLLPDSITLPLVWAGLVISLFHQRLDAETLFISPSQAIVGSLVGYLSLWSVYQAYKLLTGKEAMGYGDFKLLAALGAWMGWKMLPLVILLSSLVGAVTGVAMIVFAGRGKQVPIPFGPFLAAAGWIALLWGNEIIDFYFELSGL